MKKILSIIALSIAVMACGGKTNLETALIQAGDNRAELEKVLNHYAVDSLKYKAACFLIENMPYHYYYTGEEVDYEKQFFKMLHETALSPEVIADSLNRGRMNEQFGRTELKYDIREVDSVYLVHNIDWAFKVWREQPWGKKVSFENFCEYVLPYRVGDECPVEWRERLYDKYNSLLDSIRLKPESVFPWIVADALLDSLKKRSPRFVSYSYAKHSAGPEIADWLSGNCEDLADAFTYICRSLGIPIVVCIVAVIVTIVMLVKVIPSYEDMFADLGTDLPWITKFYVAMSHGIQNYWFIIIPVIIAAAIGIKYFAGTNPGKHVFGKIALKLPLFKKLTVKSAASMMARTLSTLMGAGVPLIEAVDIVSGVMGNIYFKEALQDAREEITIGMPLSRPLQESGLFPPMVYQMIRIGEEAGSTEEMLDKIADYYDEEVEMEIQSLMAALEPMIIIVLAIVVGGLIAACMAPMVSMYAALDNL